MQRILGIDYGEKRIGLAITDSANMIASPFKAIPNDEAAAKTLIAIIEENNVGKIVIGVPINLKGEYGHEARIVLDFIENIIGNLGLPVIKVDERFTSKISEGILYGHKNNNSACRKKNRIEMLKERKTGEKDKISASLILGDYLAAEKFKNPGNP